MGDLQGDDQQGIFPNQVYPYGPGDKNNCNVGGRYLFEGVPFAFSSSATIGNDNFGLPYTVSGSSVWPLDPHNYFGPGLGGAGAQAAIPFWPGWGPASQATSSQNLYDTAQSGSGELQNAFNYILFHTKRRNNYNTSNWIYAPTASLVYNLRVPTARVDLGLRGTGTGYWGYPLAKKQTGTDSIICVTGDAVWQVTGSGKTPYQSYGSSSLNTRHVGKDYTIVPEFRISEHMNRYVNDHGGDFWVDNNAFLDLSGATINNSSEENFFQYYTNSDFLKLFGVVDEAYGEKQLVDDKIIKKDKLALRCSAILNFLPYKGFLSRRAYH